MFGNSAEYNPLMNNYYYRNSMNKKYHKSIYYPTKKSFINMNQMNTHLNPYQSYNNNFFNNNQNLSFSRNNNNILYNNMNKYKSFYPKNNFRHSGVHNKAFVEEFKENDRNYFATEKTFSEEFAENKIKNKKNKKNSMNSATTNQKNNEPSTDDENDNKEEIEEGNLNIDNYLDEQKINVTEDKQGKRRFSNSSNSSDCSKASQSTLDTSICSIKEKDVFEEKVNNLKENNTVACPDQRHQTNPAFENTEILNVNVKISKDKTAIFKLKRFDDLFLTIKLFCEINSVDEKLIKPLIIKSLATLNTIYQVMNSKLEEKQIDVLKKVKNL